MRCFARLAGLLVLSSLVLSATAWAEPVGIISDVDDTVRVTGVGGRLDEVLVRLKKKYAYAGMSLLYTKLADAAKAEPSRDIYFVSAGPQQITFLTRVKSFLVQNRFPVANVFLRDLFEGENSLAFKSHEFVRLMNAHPTQKFLFIGDDTEHDASAMENAYKETPSGVAAMYVHSVQGKNAAHVIEAEAGHHERAEQVPYFTAVEVALHEMKRGEIPITVRDAEDIAQAIRTTDHFEDKVVPGFAKLCPRTPWLTELVGTLQLPLSDALKKELSEIQTRVNAICTTRALK